MTPLVWTFDGPFDRCLADAEDTLRRAIVLVGDVSRVALLIDLSLPALQQRVASEELPGPRIFSCGPMLDGDPPSYPEWSSVVETPEVTHIRYAVGGRAKLELDDRGSGGA